MRARAAALERDDYRCVACGAPATEVHHIVPVAAGGHDDIDNLASLCHACHVAETRRAARAGGGRKLVRRTPGEGRPPSFFARTNFRADAPSAS